MGRIYYIMGKSAAGKDTVYKRLLEQFPELKTVVPYTTRPIREGETDGVEYFFSTEAELERLQEEGKVIEVRTYQTVLGPWSYFTVDDGQVALAGGTDYLMIGTLESYEKMQNYFGRAALIPLYLEIPDGERLSRALEREKRQKNPNYRELCRRYLADEEDFSADNLARLGITRKFSNEDLDHCLDVLGEVIRGEA